MLDTPCLVVDSGILSRNLDRMARIAADAGVSLRPHTKTHKTPELAKMQIERGAGGITVAKVSEAEVMAASGIDDIFIAFPLATPAKINRALDLTDRCRLIFAADSVEGARLLSEAASRRRKRVEVRLEIDTGMRRTGIPAAESLETARAIAGMESLDLAGIFTFRGSRLSGEPTLDRRSAGIEEGRIMTAIAGELREAGMDIRDVSVGSTPTAEFACGVPGVTEIRPGTYVFNDRMQVAYGSCSIDDCALSVLVTVVSTPGPDRIVIDGGSKTFSTDAAPGTPPLQLSGFGEVVGAPELLLVRMSEEHGIVALSGSSELRIGDRLRIIPNHVCTTVNLHNSLTLVEGSADAVRESGDNRIGPEGARGDSGNGRPGTGAIERQLTIAARGLVT